MDICGGGGPEGAWRTQGSGRWEKGSARFILILWCTLHLLSLPSLFGFLQSDGGNLRIPPPGLHAECNGVHGNFCPLVRELCWDFSQCGSIQSLFRPVNGEQGPSFREYKLDALGGEGKLGLPHQSVARQMGGVEGGLVLDPEQGGPRFLQGTDIVY